MAAANDSIPVINRRIGSRLPVEAPVYFSDASGFGALTHGRIVERSSGGLTLEAYSPVRPGTDLDIELQPGIDDQTTGVSILKGRVKHLHGDAEKGYRIGVQIAFKRPALAKARTRPVSAAPTRPAVSAPPAPEQSPEFLMPSEEPESFSRAKLAILGVILIVCVAIYVLNRNDAVRQQQAIHADGNSYILEGDNPLASEERAHVGSSLPATRLGASSVLDDDAEPLTAIPAFTDTPARIDEAERLARFVDSGSAGDRPAAPQEPRSDPLADALDPARRAVAADESGNPTAARALSAEALRLTGDLPHPWTELLGEMRSSIVDSAQRRTPFPTFDNWVGLGTQLDALPTDAPVVVYVDTDNFTLTVVRDAAPVLQFPVGLGISDSTPQGVFAIGNKILEPTWYNSGNPVAPNSPDNPLGDRWMGLNQGDNPLVYGIHPTDLPQSIGDQLSRGCIRMRPSDARTLYAMIPLGTPVVIGPGAAAKL